jgi:hypothetical protein
VREACATLLTADNRIVITYVPAAGTSTEVEA